MAKSRYNEIYYRKIKKAPPRNVYMERFFEHLEGGLKNYAVNTCCLLFPLRKGLLIIGYLNIFFEMILVIGAATETISPLFMKIQEGFSEAPSISMGVAVPTAQLAFTVVLLCATHRNDVGLLRFYMVYSIVAIGLTVVSYAIIVLSLNVFFIFALIASVLYQAYILLLVRSLIVKIRQAKCEVRMMSLKELLNRKEIEVEAPAPVYRPVPKDAGPGPLAAIVGNPKVEIVLKGEPTDVNDVKTVAEIKKDTEVMLEQVKQSNIEIKNKEDIDKLNPKEEIKVTGPLQKKDPNAKGALNAKLSFLGLKQIEQRSNDRPDTGSDSEVNITSNDKDVKKPKRTVFGRKLVDTNNITEKEKHQTAETNEITKDKDQEKHKKTFFGIKKKDVNKTKDVSSKNEPVPESAEAQVSQPEATHVKQDANDRNQNSKNEETKVTVETKSKNNEEKINKPETNNLKETKPLKEKRKIEKERNVTHEMEEIKLDVDTATEHRGSTKLETIEEEPRRKWFWKK